MNFLQRSQAAAFGIGVTGCVLLGFAIPTSRALFNIAALLIIVGWVFSGQFASKWRTVRHNPLFWPIVGIWSMLLLGALHTSAAWADVQEHWERYSKFFLVLMVISLLTDQRHRRWMWWAFIAACSVVLVSTYLNVFYLLPWSKSQALGLGANHAVFIDHIAQSLVMALFAVVLWLKALSTGTWSLRATLGLLCVSALLSITHLTSSRIGYGVVLALAVLVPSLSVPRQWAVAAVIAAVVGAVAVLFLSDLAILRVRQVFSEAATYIQGEVFTSTGARLHMWFTAFDIWMQAPWIGHGTGAYHDMAKIAFNNNTMCQIGCFHPHNQFLFFAVDHGLAGVLLFCAYLAAAVSMAWHRDAAERTLFLGFLTILFVVAMAHGPLWLFMEAYFSFGVMALLASGPSGLFAVTNTPAITGPSAAT
jgi:O-antigen ligase